MKKNTDLRSVDGHTIHLPQEIGGNVGAGNIGLPNIYVEDSVQQYPIGTRLEMGERVFHYFKAGAGITYLVSGIASFDCRLGSTIPSYDTAQPAGVGTPANPLKIDGTSLTLNALAGHTAVIYAPAAVGARQMKVISSTASAADPLNAVQTCELVLDQPTPMEITGNIGIDFFPSKYADCRSCFQAQDGALDATEFPIVGIPMATMTSGQWGWCQTWGPCFIVSNVADAPGTTGYRAVVFASDGSLRLAHESYTATLSDQFAGYTLANEGSGSEWTMLQLDR